MRPPPPRHERRQVRRCNRRGVSTDRSRCPHFTRKNGEWRRMSDRFPPRLQPEKEARFQPCIRVAVSCAKYLRLSRKGSEAVYDR